MIGDHTFSSCDQLTSITIPSSVTTIGDYAFRYCMSLHILICKSGTPPVIYGNTFEYVPDTISIFVPCASIHDYKTANNWSVFNNFIGILDTTFISDTVCQGKIYTDNGFTATDGAGIYYRTQRTANNCDSVICLTLSEYGVVPLTQYSATICQGNVYSDDNFAKLIQAGDYYDTLQNTNGCDSVVCLHLSVHAIFLTQYSASICQGNIYNDDNFTNITQAGKYYDTLRNRDDCDSIIELTLTVNPIYFFSDTVMINQGEVYNFNGKSLIEEGIYYDTLQTIYGCDSIFGLNLTYKTSIVETEGMGKIKVYPNPTTGELRIENGELKIDNIEIYDILGKKQYSPFEGGRGMSLIDISHLLTGIYFIKIRTETGNVMRKIIKE